MKDQTSTPTTSETPSVPEAYDFKAPDGLTLDADLLAEASPIFKELGLSQDAAQKLVDFYATKSKTTNEALAKTVDDMRAGWRNEIAADKEIGGKLDSVKIELGRAKDKMSAETRAAFDNAMNTTGMGDHPGIVKGLYELAKLVNEGTHVTGGTPSPLGQSRDGTASRPTIAGALYPNLPH